MLKLHPIYFYGRQKENRADLAGTLPLLDFKLQVASCLCIESKVSNKRKGNSSQAVVVEKNKRAPKLCLTRSR
ncbi:hypothetical protein CHARACLAT_009504 [Characodon lateralis]|uniref:Uncharacterized protein n=1 Tax=Characodon lateralis TaxID=208331 RepID=A0ABU7DPQ7_9TELE|nr:hypothetical protein [Characodon lateralis]